MSPPDRPTDTTAHDVGPPDGGEADRASAVTLAGRFADTYGRPASGIFAAPGRVNLMGEHTDYNFGFCLPVALQQSTFVAVAPRGDARVRIISLQQDAPFTGELAELSPVSIKGWAAYAAGVLWALRESGVEMPGMDLLVDSQVPVGAGLSSSAALECAVALAACSVAEVPVDHEQRRRLVEVCMRAEREVAGAPTGGLDQTVSLLAEPSSALLIDCLDWTTAQVPWRAAEVGVELLVVDTRVTHSLSDGQYADRHSECARAAGLLGLGSLRELRDLDDALTRLPEESLRRRVRHVHSENDRVHSVVSAIRAGDFARVGELFSMSHASLRDDFQVSCEELDVTVAAARDAGALGARMTGGGFGGSAVVLAHRARLPDIAQAVASAFAAKGFTPPRLLGVVPSAGARQVRPERPISTAPLH